MRRPFASIAPNGLFRSRASRSGALSRLSHSRIQQLLILLLLLTVATVVFIGHNSGHAWPSLQAIHVPHGTLMPHHAAPAASSTVKQPQTLRKFTGNLEFPIWWHAPFIAQSGNVCLDFDY